MFIEPRQVARSMHVYEVRADDVNFQQLSYESEWQRASPFMFAKALEGIESLEFRPRTLEEDVLDEEELLEDDDGGDPNQARSRFEAGVGDCVSVLGFVTTLVFSSKARQRLGNILDSTGQVFPVLVGDATFFVFNCTRLIDAVDAQRSEVRFVGNGRPSQFTRLVLANDAVQGETLFKVKWPASANATVAAIPPPLMIFATQDFVDLVGASGLDGFRFKPVEVV